MASLPLVPGVQRVVFTAAFGTRDRLDDPGPVPSGWEAFCFSDVQTHPRWRVVHVESPFPDPGRSAKVFKIVPHRVFPDALYSLWLDANISLACDLKLLVERELANCDLALHRHPERDCVYEEVLACIRQERDDPAIMCAQVLRYALDGYPRHAGLTANGVLLRRHSEPIMKFSERWWREIDQGSWRDQLSFGYLARKLGVRYALFDSNYWTGPLFAYRPRPVKRWERPTPG
jgi:hypothetical protein